MSDFSKMNLSKARPAMNKEERPMARLERADHACNGHGEALHHQIGRRLKNVFPPPEHQEEAFEQLLRKISSRLP
jgi:hypothetical protein